ncbi:hypothetical protein F5B19DRAFT_500335 [Rostrohypoxylon terebratum]|nr:hypothetical protein F5B19DRAFT_500335 [Rostrohypoxylon terebratum]
MAAVVRSARTSDLPELQGESNFREWRHYILEHARYCGLEDFFDGTAEEPIHKDDKVQYNHRRKRAMSLITESIGRAWDDVEATGWDPDTETDPKILWDLVHAVARKLPHRTTTELLNDITNASVGEKQTICDFNISFHRTCVRLAERDIVLPSKAKVIFMMNALRNRFPLWHAQLQEDFEEGHLDWHSLQAQIRHASWLDRHHGIQFSRA